MASRGLNYVSKRLPCKGGGDPREGGLGEAVAVTKERAGDSDGAMVGVRVRYALKVVPTGSADALEEREAGVQEGRCFGLNKW